MKKVTFRNNGKVIFVDDYGCHPSILIPGIKIFYKINIGEMYIGLIK